MCDEQEYNLTTNYSIEVSSDMELLITLEQIILNLSEETFDTSVQQTIKLFDINFPYSFNFIVSKLVYSAFYSQKHEFDLYLNYLKVIQTKEEEINKNNPKIIEIFTNYISKKESEEAYYIIERMIENNVIDSNITQNIKSKYFSQYKKMNEIMDDGVKFSYVFIRKYRELSKNNWELHKKYVKEGVNPNEISKIIRNDEIEKLQEISSQNNFNFNQKIQPSLYERFSFINKEDVSLINFAAFFGSVNCFKYLLMNGSKIEDTGKYAVAGGNLEIIHLCEQNHSSFKNAYETAIEFHQNDIFKYLYE